MLHIVICEDHPSHRAHIESVVKEHIKDTGRHIQLAVSTDSPIAVLNYLKKNPNAGGLYLLDVELENELSGIELAMKVREADVFAKIVFITSHSELAYLTFTHKVNAMDYIAKDKPGNVEKHIIECIEEAYGLSLSQNENSREFYMIKTGGEVWNIPHDEIFYFETNPSVRHRMILHLKDSQIEFRALISEVAEISENFFRCNQSYVINTQNVVRVDKNEKMIEMKNGDMVPITVRKINNLVSAINKTA